MPRINATYAIPLDNAKLQSTRSADRRMSAMTAALAAMARGDTVKVAGCCRDIPSQLVAEFVGQRVVPERAVLWANGVNLAKPSLDYEVSINGDTLSQYQCDAIEALNVSGGIIAFDTGLGKTITTVAALTGYANQGYNKRCFIVCPVNALGAWQPYREFLEGWFDEVAVVSMDSLHKLKGLDPEPSGCVVYDELHLLSVAKAKRTKEAHQLRKCFDVGLGLTGTLLHGGVEKALSALDLATPGAALFTNRWTAGEHFKCLVPITFQQGKTTQTKTDLVQPSGEGFQAFATYLDRFTTIVKKDSKTAAEAKIPSQSKTTVKLGEPWGSMEDLVVECAQKTWREEDRLPNLSEVLCELRRMGLQEKLSWLHSFLQAHADEPVVIAAWSKEHTLPALQDFMTQHNYNYVYVDGSVTGKARIEAVRAFQAGEVPYYVGQIDASCVSVNLFAAKFSVAFEHTNRAANYDQFLGRTCRRGQTRVCEHFDLIANAAQQKVLDALRRGVNFDSKMAEWQELRRLLNHQPSTPLK